MSEELKKLVEETVTNMKQMDKESLLIMKSNSEVLKARDCLDKESCDEKAGQEVRKMLRKIYQELVLIRKELQTIHSSKEFNPQIVLDERIIQISMKSYLEEI